mmetsp:Transcript_1738/g.4378  ORF Transcript_1738/g.4378 Transcript_1738/m.4378 type:complete len:247 (+) Transcript_1738:985-1725(+)
MPSCCGSKGLAYRGRSRESYLAHVDVGRQLMAYGRRISKHHIQHTIRQPCTLRQLRQGYSRQWRQLCRLDHHRAASRQCRCHLPCYHGERKVPWRDGSDDAHRLLQRQHPPITACALQHIPFNASALLRHPLHTGSPRSDLCARFCQGLPALAGQDGGEVICMLEDLSMPPFQDAAPLFGCVPAPLREHAVCSSDGCPRLIHLHEGHRGQQAISGWISDLKRSICAAPMRPLSTDPSACMQDACVF